MPKTDHNITVFEHQVLRTDRGEKRLTDSQLIALQSYYGNGVPYFSLVHHGVQFNEHVGVLQVGNTVIEVLPKADKYSGDKTVWRNILIGMLRAVSGFEIKSTSNANLKIRPNTILDLYFELFIKEVEYLLHGGLIKKYCKKEGNTAALKGNILFAKHIQQNVAHQERFYTRYSNYDVTHPLNQIIYKTLVLLKRINTNPSLHGRLGALLLNFPEMPDLKVSEALFKKLIFNRKSLAYKRAVEIAKMILLQYHPDISKGKNDVLALMFDMNKLWEEFVFVSLKKHRSSSLTFTAQTSKNFWRPTGGRKTTMKPDIVINKEKATNFVLDTKWKNMDGSNPSPDDLRQLFVYQHYYQAERVALVYPGNLLNKHGKYFNPDNSISGKVCSVLTLEENSNIREWQKEIYVRIDAWSKEIID